MLDKIFSWSKKKTEETEPEIRLGRYSDNNKTVEKVERWNEAESLFKEKKYLESISAFFEYLRDDDEDNVFHTQEGTKGRAIIMKNYLRLRCTLHKCLSQLFRLCDVYWK